MSRFLGATDAPVVALSTVSSLWLPLVKQKIDCAELDAMRGIQIEHGVPMF